MKKIVNNILNILKILLLLIASGLILYGLFVSYGRLNKPIIGAIPVMLPFVLLIVLFAFNFICNIKIVNKNLFYNIATTISLFAITYVGYRAKFESNATLYYRYKIGYNPSFLADNLGIIRTIMYLLVLSNILLVVYAKFFKKDDKKIEVVKEEKVLSEIKESDNRQDIEDKTEELLLSTSKLDVINSEEKRID